jgi:hypothetical protein
VYSECVQGDGGKKRVVVSYSSRTATGILFETSGTSHPPTWRHTQNTFIVFSALLGHMSFLRNKLQVKMYSPCNNSDPQYSTESLQEAKLQHSIQLSHYKKQSCYIIFYRVITGINDARQYSTESLQTAKQEHNIQLSHYKKQSYNTIFK